jgi:hypothetical protein
VTVTTSDPAVVAVGQSIEQQLATAIAAHERRLARLEATSGQVGAGSLRGNLVIAGGTITTASIQSGSITADLIDVSSLDAITATMGTLTVNGTLTIGGAGKIRTAAIGGSLAYTEFSPAGVRAQDAGGVTTFNLDSATGILTARMVIQTGTQMPLGFIGGANLLSNSSCERPDFALTPYASMDPGHVTVTRDTAQAWHGLASFKVLGDGTSVIGLGSNIGTKVNPAAKYVFSTYIYTPVARTFELYINEYTGATYNVHQQHVTTALLPAGQWSRVTIPVFTTDSTTDNVLVYVYPTTATTSPWWVDGLQLEPGEIPTAYAPRGDEVLPGSITVNELAANSVSTAKLQAGSITTATLAAGAVTAAKFSAVVAGGNLVSTATTSFENDASGWLPNESVQIHLNNSATISRQTSYSYLGAASLYVVCPFTYPSEGTAANNIPGPFRLGEKYTFSAYVLPGTVANQQVDIVVQGLTAPGVAASGDAISSTTTPLPGSVWTRIQVTWAPTADRPYCNLIVRNRDAAARTFFVDAVQLENGDVATAWRQYIAPATIEGSTITGAIIQTAVAGTNPRVQIDTANGFVLTDASGNVVVRVKGGGGGIDLATSTSTTIPTERQLRWLNGSTISQWLGVYDNGSTVVGAVRTRRATGGVAQQVVGIENPSGSGTETHIVFNSTATASSAQIAAGGVARMLFDEAGNSDFVQYTAGGGWSAGAKKVVYGIASVSFSASSTATVNITHNLNGYPGCLATGVYAGTLFYNTYITGVSAYPDTATVSVTCQTLSGNVTGNFWFHYMLFI